MIAKTKLDALTGLRFFAAFAIVLHHIRGNFGVPASAFLGWNLDHGVTVFFVLSGFVLTYSYPTLDEAGAVRRFYLARIARIWPAHVVTLLAVVALGSPFDAPHFLANAMLLHAWVPSGDYFFSYNSVSWSISTELGFYLAFPLLIRNFGATWAWKLAACFIVSASMAVLAWQFALPGYSGGNEAVIQGMVMASPLARIFEFSLGMTAALLWQRFRGYLVNLRFGEWAIIETVSVALLALGSIWINAKLQAIVPAGAVEYWTAQTLAPVFPAALLLIVLASSKGPLACFLAWHPVRWLGEVSFAIYLTHQLALRFFASFPTILDGLSQWTMVFAYFTAVLCASAALHHWVELPAQRFIRMRPEAMQPSYSRS